MVLYDVNLDTLAESHLELIDTVVDNLLEQHVYTVIALRTVAELSDVHTGAQADVLHVTEVAYRVIAIFGGTHLILVKFQIFIFGHII